MKSLTLASVERVTHQTDALVHLATDVVTLAAQQGATACEVAVSLEQGFSVCARLGSVEQIDFNRDKSMSVTVYVGQRSGSASTSDLTHESLQKTVAAAYRIAQFTDEDPYAGLADAVLMARYLPDLDLYHPWDLSPTQALDLAIECEAIAMAHDQRIKNSEGASVSVNQGLYIYSNSHRFVGVSPYTQHSISCSVIAEAGQDMQRDSEYTVARHANDLDPVAKVALAACNNTVARLNSRKISTQKVPVIFDRALASGLFRLFLSAIKGANLYRRSSFLLDKLGERIFPDFMQLHEKPFTLKGWGSAAFDSDGLQCTEKYFVRDGVLQNYLLDVYAARKLQLQPQGNAGGVHNLHVATSQHTLIDLLRMMNKGLLITELMGNGVNIVTGDYSQGIAGFWVDRGEIQFPVAGLTIAGNLATMFQQIVAIGNDIDHRHNILTGSVLIAEMVVAGD